jgi:Leucine-rich repeat (LRR) protein
LHNCKYETVQQGITKFKDLKILDLSNNYIENIPPYFQQLNLLEELDLSFNRFTTFPVVLLKLPNLKRVDMRYNSSKMEKPFSKEEREKMMAALPDCTVVFE